MKRQYESLTRRVQNFASRPRSYYASLSSCRRLNDGEGEKLTCTIPGIAVPPETPKHEGASCSSLEKTIVNSSIHSLEDSSDFTISRNDARRYSDILEEDTLSQCSQGVVPSPVVDDEILKGSKQNVFNRCLDRVVSNLRQKNIGDSNLSLKDADINSKSESVISNKTPGRIYPDNTTGQRGITPNLAVTIDHDLASIVINHGLNPKDNSIPTIIRAMSNHRDKAQVQIFGCNKLKQLAKQSGANKRSIMLNGGVDAIISVIEHQSNDAALVALAFSSLCSLTSHDSSNKYQITKTHVIPYLLSTMKHFLDNEAIQEEGCKSIFNLTFTPTHLLKLILLTTTTVDPSVILVDASRRFPDSCKNINDITLKRMAPSENDIIEMIQSVNCDVDDVTQLMNAHLTSQTVQEMACVKLNILSKIPDLDDDANVTTGAASLILPPLFAAMTEYRDRASIQALACSVLSNLCETAGYSKKKRLNEIVTPEMIKLVEDTVKRFKCDDVVQEKGCAFLRFCECNETMEDGC
eukprot:CAMPEP_0172500158 /NCGR_PEP_ID=MMETSP1066-20121228/135214_1 /TAXON_ID=671091 /ORGANISM="Coscinodiscus wailesii, Strain CCMP2513" /LENGTH=522 /DNA_ID=CAMNT_0013274251 /DNA_START=164 /DNA_END=1732 /DNA_ORIENTATION=-